MIIGVPKEIKTHENRVSVTPGGAQQMTLEGHQVLVEQGAGLGSGFTDQDYSDAGAQILPTANEVWESSEMIMKVKEPIAQEYPLMREGQILFTYLHFAASKELTDAVVASKCVAIAYETVEAPDRSLPLLIPMSEVAGRMSVQQGAKFLEKAQGGRGVLLGGIPGVKPAHVLVLGGGIVGVNAAKMASGLGAVTTIMDVSLPRLRYLDDVMPANVQTRVSNEAAIREVLPETDVVIGAVLKPGAKAPHLLTREMLSLLKPGSVVVDVAIDQGGCFETSKATTHDNPVYVVDDIVHYCVANMPGAVPFTSTMGLTNVTLPYALQIANKGWKKALSDSPELAKGLNVCHGHVTYKDVAELFDYPVMSLESQISA